LEFMLLGLIVLGVIFVLPLALWVALYRTRTRLSLLEAALEEQTAAVRVLSAVVAELKGRAPAAAPTPPPPERPPIVERPFPELPQRPVAPTPTAVPRTPAPTVPPPPAPPLPPRPAVPPPPAPPVLPRPAVERPVPGRVPAAAASETARPSAAREPVPAGPPPPGARPPAPPPTQPPQPPKAEPPAFDWESLVGVKLFSAIAGIALVFAAVLFLRYSIQQGWLQPPVRVLIGVAVAVALLVLCELKVARNYQATANALDAAAIAILFATFFAAHALWDLIPAFVTFGLLAAVTALAVLLSIRRESLFIAVLGLLGGFATPALLSTGENRPVPLFAYLVLLNIGLAWVAYRQVWPVLTFLTLVLTTAYQWVWVYKFLAVSELSLAMGIFAIFPVLGISSLLLGRRARVRPRDTDDDVFERTSVLSAALPLLFVAYLAAVPAYGAHPSMLFGFLLFVDAGLLAVTIVLGRMPLHAVAALATLFVSAVWLATSYRGAARTTALAFNAAFVLLYVLAPTVARRFSRPLSGSGETALFAAPGLLFVYPVILGIDPGAAAPWPIFGPLLALLLICAGRAIALDRGAVFFIASFLTVAAEAVWSMNHLTLERLWSGVSLYAVFGIVNAAAPVLARRFGRPLRPESGTALVLLSSLGLLLFLSTGPIAPEAIWALALLLAILNAGMFVESASSRVPVLAQVGSALSWLILAAWWLETAGAVGVLGSLAVMTGLTLITLGGHAWAYRSTAAAGEGVSGGTGAPFGRGLYLGLAGHLFLFFIALNREWSLPPWPVFGALAVVTLATSVAALGARAPLLHVGGIGAAALVLAGWTAVAGVTSWTLIGVSASAAVTAYALAWMSIHRQAGFAGPARRAAAVAVFGSELTAIIAAASAGPPPFAALLAIHVANIAILLTLAWTAAWKGLATGAVAAAWAAVLQWQFGHDLVREWRELLVLAASFYALFTGYALAAGPRRHTDREPWVVALAAAAMAFFAARDAFDAGGLGWMIGVVPVVEGFVTALLLRALLRMERATERDMTRLAAVAGAALAFVTVAIPLQLDHQWITIGWALEGVALAWLYQRVPHRGLLLACSALLAVVFVRLALNPSVWTYEPRGTLRVLNWYLYTYLAAAVAMFLSGWFLAKTSDRLASWLPRVSYLLPGGGVILLFLLLNIEIADYYATGPDIVFRFGVSVAQDLTYTIGWLAFGMLLLAAGIYLRTRPARITAVTLIAITAFKCFLYDLRSLEGLSRVASFVGLAVALALVSLALQKYVLAKPGGAH
jgi:hypothetical protein